MREERTIALDRLHAGQQRVLAGAARPGVRYVVVDCGRRWGKTSLAIERVVRPALAGKPVAWFGPTYRNLAETWRKTVELLTPVIKQKSEQEHRLELITRGVVDMWSLEEPKVARGRAYARVVFDEAAQVGNLEEAWTYVIRPTLTDYAGDAWFLSTPNGLNFFHTLYLRGQDEQSSWWSVKAPSAENPFLPAGEIEAARGELPERVFAQEYLADFLSEEGAVFRRIKESATALPQNQAIQGHAYAVGVDWGKVFDFTVFAVLDLTTRELVYLDRFNQIDYQLQLQRLGTLRERFRPSMYIVERNSIGDPLIDALRARGFPIWAWTATNVTKGAAIEALAVALEQGRIKLLDEPILLGELLAYRAERLPSGALRYSAPEGQHDDTVMALAMVWQAAAHPTGKDTKQQYTLELGGSGFTADALRIGTASEQLWVELGGQPAVGKNARW